jgi:hypothetical protein
MHQLQSLCSPLARRCVAAGAVIDKAKNPLLAQLFKAFCRAVPRRQTAAAVVLALATGVSPSLGQDARGQAAGRALFNEGVALFNKGDFESACPKLEASLKQFPGIGTRGKLAECYEKLGRVASAYQAYREVAQLATRSGDPAREQIASERAKALEPKLSYVTVVLPPANDVPGIAITRNGRTVERTKLGSAEIVDAGDIAVEASAPGKKTWNGHVAVMQGLSVKIEIPRLAGEGEAPTSTSTSTSTPDAEPAAWQKPVGLVLVGVGVVGLGAAGLFGLSARSTYDEAFDGGGCDRASKTCDAPGQSAVDDAHAKATLSTVLFGVGGALVLGGAVVFLTASSSKARAVQVMPTTYAAGGGLVVGGTL